MMNHLPQVGARVRLTEDLRDQYHPLPTGLTGTVTFVDSMGTLHVNWDDGARLGIVPEVDRYEVIER